MFDPLTMLGFHTWISLVALVAGLLLMRELLRAAVPPRLTEIFLVTAILTSATGFLLPASGFLPSHAFGILSLALLGLAVVALYRHRLAGIWRGIFAVAVVAATWLDAFVAVVQTFLKAPPVRALAPTQSEPPFAIAQGLLLLLFIWLGWRAWTVSRAPRAA